MLSLLSLRMVLGNVGGAGPVTVWRSPDEVDGITGPPAPVGEIAEMAIVPAASAANTVGKVIPESLLAGGRISHVGLTAVDPDAQIGDEIHDAAGVVYTIEWRGVWMDVFGTFALSQPEAV